MKNFTQSTILLFSLVVIITSSIKAQSGDCTTEIAAANATFEHWTNYYENEIQDLESVISTYYNELEILRSQVSEMDAIVAAVSASSSNDYINLPSGWSMFGYTCVEPINAIEGFAQISDKIEIIKDEWGMSYIPSWEFNAMGDLNFSEGYQIKMLEEVTDFQFCKKNAPIHIGCSDPDAFNYDPNAILSTSSSSVCIEKVFGCTDQDYLEFNPYVNTNDSDQCLTLKILGCTNMTALNYSTDANFDDGSCELPIYGCTDQNASNYNPSANIDNITVTNNFLSGPYFEEDSNGDIINFTDSFNEDNLNIDVISGSYVLWGSFSMRPNTSVTIVLNDSLPFSVLDFGSSQIQITSNTNNLYNDCNMLGVEQYNQMYSEFEGEVFSCDQLFELVSYAKVTGSNGYAYNINSENYDTFGGAYELFNTLSENFNGVNAITIETYDDVNFQLSNLTLMSVDESGSSCTF